MQIRSKPELPHISAIVRGTEDYIDLHAYLDDEIRPSDLFFEVLEGAFDQVRKSFDVAGVISAESSMRHCHYRLTFDANAKRPSATFRRFSNSLLSILSFPNISRIRHVLDTRTLRLESELQERNQAERRLNQTEGQLAHRLANIHDVLMEFDTQAQLVYLSENVATKLGYQTDELFADPMVIFPNEHRLNVKESLNRPPGTSEIYQLNLLQKDGSHTWHEISSSCFLVGENNHLILVARDISERRQLDSEKLNTQKLESLGQLTGAIAHDFNNLLVPILGNVELMLQDLEPESGLTEIAHEIRNAASKASGLTKQLLVHSGDGYEQRKFDLSEELQGLLNLIRISIPNNIRFHHEISAEQIVFGDATQLSQAVMNLIATPLRPLAHKMVM